jgi:hypothetical protein
MYIHTAKLLNDSTNHSLCQDLVHHRDLSGGLQQLRTPDFE